MLLFGVSLSLTGCAPAMEEDDEGGKGEPSLAEAPTPLQLGKADGVYSAQMTAEFADDHWNDGLGLCAEFTSRSLRAGNFPIARYTWVPDIYAALSEFPFPFQM